MWAGGARAVYGDWLHASNDATVLIYSHYDVQPVDPEDLWKSPAFKPSMRDKDRIYARGASDDKGPLLATLYALKSVFASNTSGLPVNVKMLIEGEEEIGSPTLDSIFEAYGKSLLSADYVFSADGGQASRQAPLCLLAGLRGNAALEVTVTRDGGDLHSGEYGGAVANPLHHLVHILSDLRDYDSGKITVDGFYDDVDEMSEDDKNDVKMMEKYTPWKAVQKALGTEAVFGEKGFTPFEQVWFRPTLEIVGMIGGYTEEGVKTVLPRRASAKISCRLVTSQRAGDILQKLQAHIEKIESYGLTVTAEPLHFKCDPVRVKKDGLGNAAAVKVLKSIKNETPIYIYSGGSVPFVEIAQRRIDRDAVTLTFNYPGTNVHGPNEFVFLPDLMTTQIAYIRLLYQLDNMHQEAQSQGSTVKDEL